MNTQTKKILQIILSIVMIISVFLKWFSFYTSYNMSGSTGMGSFSSNANTGTVSLSGFSIFSMGPAVLILLISIVSLIISFTKYRFINSIFGITILGIVIYVLLTFKNNIMGQLLQGGVSYSGIGGSVDEGINYHFTTGIGLYLLLVGSIIFSIVSYDKKLVSLFGVNSSLQNVAISTESNPEKVKTHMSKKTGKGILISVIIIVILGLGIGSFYIYNLNTGINSKDYCINKLCSGSWVSDSKDVISKDTIIESILGEVEAIDNFKQQKWIFNKDFTFSMTETSSIQGSLQGYVISNHIKTDNYKGTWSLGEVIKKDNPVRLVNIIKYQSMSDTSSFVFVPQLNSNGIYTPFQLSVLDNDKDELTIPINFKNEHTDNFIYNHQIEDTSQNSDKSSNKIVSKPIKNTDTVSKPSIDTIKTTKDTSKPISVNEQSQVDVNILGKYTGKFSKTSILIVLDSISGNNVYGYDIVDNNKRNIKGPCYTNRDMFSLNLSEPGTMKTDGVFNIEIDKNSYSGDGTWKMLVGNLSIDFKLTKE